MSVDAYLDKQFDSSNYNCAHLVSEVWKEETGVDVSHILSGFLTDSDNRKAILSDLRKLKLIEKPVTPSIVFMQPAFKSSPHVGIYLRGKVLHIRRTGVEFQPLEIATLGFKKVRFYICQN